MEDGKQLRPTVFSFTILHSPSSILLPPALSRLLTTGGHTLKSEAESVLRAEKVPSVSGGPPGG
jgi:hypothetical protein